MTTNCAKEVSNVKGKKMEGDDCNQSERKVQSVRCVTIEPRTGARRLHECLRIAYACCEIIITNEKGALCFPTTTLHLTAVYVRGILKNLVFIPVISIDDCMTEAKQNIEEKTKLISFLSHSLTHSPFN